MDEFKSEMKLKIKKVQKWELWLVSPTKDAILGAFNSLDELNQVQITLYNSWENARYTQDPYQSRVKH